MIDQLLTARRYNEAATITRNENTRILIRAIPDPAARPSALRLLAQPAVRADMPQSSVARYYFRLGQPDSALVILNRAAESWEPAIAYYAHARSLQPLWPDPRFAEFRRKLGIQ